MTSHSSPAVELAPNRYAHHFLVRLALQYGGMPSYALSRWEGRLFESGECRRESNVEKIQKTLQSRGWTTARISEDYFWAGTRMTRLTQKGRRLAWTIMTPESLRSELTKIEYDEAIVLQRAQETEKPLMAHRYSNEEWLDSRSHNLHICLLFAALDFLEGNPRSTPVDGIVPEVWQHCGRMIGAALIGAAADEPRWLPFVRSLPEDFFRGFAESLESLNDTESYDFDDALRITARTLTAGFPFGEAVADWFVFHYDFLRVGRPEEQLAKMHAGTCWHHLLGAVLSMEKNEAPAVAVEACTQALRAFRKGKRRLFENPIHNWLYGLALFRDRDNPQTFKKWTDLLGFKKLTQDPHNFFLLAWAEIAVGQPIVTAGGWIDQVENDMYNRRPPAWQAVNEYLLAAILTILDHRLRCSVEQGTNLVKKYFPLLGLLDESVREEPEDLEKFVRKFQVHTLMPVYVRKPSWALQLERMIQTERIAADAAPAAKKTAESPREAIFYCVDRPSFTLSLRLRKSKDGVTWSKGTNVTFSSFKKGHPAMDEFDHRMARAFIPLSSSMRQFEVDDDLAFSTLIGCKRVVDADDPDRHIDVVAEAFRVSVEENEEGFQVRTNYPFSAVRTNGIAYFWRDDGEIAVIRLTEHELQLVRLLEEEGDAFPKEAAPMLKEFLSLLSRRITVFSSLIDDTKKLRKVKADARITFRWQPDNDAFRITALVRPLKEAAVTCAPGTGLPVMTLTHRGETVQVTRNLEKEDENLNSLLRALVPLQDCAEDDCVWYAPIDRALAFLECLRENADRAVIEWPEGERLVVKKAPLHFGDLQLGLTTIDHWFSLTGSVRLDEKTTLTVQTLLEKIREAQGNFIRLGDKEYVALESAFKKRLQQLDSMVSTDRKGESRISVFQTPFLEECAEEGMALTTDDAFHRFAERIRSAEEAPVRLPQGLRAELRDYQVEGFEWLSRLAQWGAGALLADDMGLGKTVQTIALLLSRAQEGPALVVMPAAVLYNWAEEIARFAPSLSVTLLNREADRQAAVEAAGPHDVLLVTYGVLASEIDRVAAKRFATVVLDEAHAVKNRETKMAKAVMRLESDARVLLTGTPLQNHLSEIWTLFAFANPGLLGSFSEFSEKYLLPIEKNRDREKQRQLKRLLTPFLLRRTKAEVLDELPEKTDITLRVTLSDEERALYESLRQRAAVSLEEGSLTAIEALTELTRLRQAACHPALIDPSLPFASSKTKAFLSLVDDLVAGGHRMLVFSQFTSHLALIRAALERHGVEYLYLDGATGAKDRQKLVETFRTGTMPIFLISLKAGGTGLNLTAADYVIHLDPWWNPAIEDQASDRAYRIGQKNPVTIYRLIAEDTIEEKILRLHETKKSLADALLEGTDVSSRLSRDEILALLAG